MIGYILITPDDMMLASSLSHSKGGAQYAVVGTPGADGRMHTWGWWRSHGWRCKRCEVTILSGEPEQTED